MIDEPSLSSMPQVGLTTSSSVKADGGAAKKVVAK
jgi:hypothetical protein